MLTGFGVEGLGGACDDVHAGAHRRQPWAVSTPSGILYADHLVLTRCAHSQLRRMLAELGVAAGQNLMAAMHALGMYLVGVGELITPRPRKSCARPSWWARPFPPRSTRKACRPCSPAAWPCRPKRL